MFSAHPIKIHEHGQNRLVIFNTDRHVKFNSDLCKPRQSGLNRCFPTLENTDSNHRMQKTQMKCMTCVSYVMMSVSVHRDLSTTTIVSVCML